MVWFTIHDAVWITARIFIPLAAVVFMVEHRWGEENVLYAITVPFLLLVINMYVSWQLRPTANPPGTSRAVARDFWWWHTTDILALLCLGICEAAAAVIAEEKANAAVVFVIVPTFGVYMLLSWSARVQSQRIKMNAGC
jgi:hypothetical protein